MECNLVNLSNNNVGTAQLNPLIFSAKQKLSNLHDIVRWQLAKRRAGTHKTKGISDVSGTTAKPYGELKRSSAKLSGPIALPRKDSKFIVNRSPHVDKKSREQFEIRTSRRLIVLHDLTPTMMQMLTGLSFSAGVEVDLKVKEVKV